MHKMRDNDKFIVRWWMMIIRRDNIKEDKWSKFYVKLKPSKRNITLKLK